MKLLILTFVFFFSFTSFSQITTPYLGLQAKGEIPKDFTQLSTDKYKEDYKNKEGVSLDREFYLNTRFYIDYLLLSGNVIFNDTISNYVTDVARVVLVNHDDLFNKLRFYTIKSNVANAFSTDQGIIFITTGLISRLENEAQLAFILAHEISHYTEHHVRKGYAKKKEIKSKTGRFNDQSYGDALTQMSIYDKGNELDADEKGALLYLNTIYDPYQIEKGFDVLLETEYPFKNDTIPNNYMSCEHLKIPERLYLKNSPKIKVEMDYNDHNHSHPNIQTRIENLIKYSNGQNNIQNKKYIVSESTFMHVRDLSRFESIRQNLKHKEYIEALFSIYQMSSTHQNRFLDLSKVQALYGLTKYKNNNSYLEVTSSSSYKSKGPIYKLHCLFRDISQQELNVIALRHSYNFMNYYKNDNTFKLYYTELEKELALKSQLNYLNLKSISLSTYNLKKKNPNALKFNKKDSIQRINESNLSKSIKIKRINELNKQNTKTEILSNSNSFHLFALNDIVSNDSLLMKLESIVHHNQQSQLITQKDKQPLAINKLVVVDPVFQNYSLKGNKKLKKSEKKKINLSDSYQRDYRKLDLEVDLVDSKNLTSEDIERFNDLASIRAWMLEVFSHEDELNFINSAHENMAKVSEKHGTQNYLFSGVFSYKMRHELANNNFAKSMITSVYFAPIGLIDLLIVHNYFQYVAIEINAETDQIEFIQVNDVNLKSLNKIVEFYAFDVLYQLNRTK
jgi:Zn-dependent protease with chaperone function